jgi:hypothetical protein
MVGFVVQLVVQLVLAMARLAVLLGYLAGILIVALIRFLWREIENAKWLERWRLRDWIKPEWHSNHRRVPRPLRPKPWE